MFALRSVIVSLAAATLGCFAAGLSVKCIVEPDVVVIMYIFYLLTILSWFINFEYK